ncbi:MAG: hypothetical protein RR749_03135 [Comamonas sp.]
MKITGGSFGVHGKAYVGQDNRLYINGAVEKSFAASEVASVNSEVNKETKFSVFSLLIGIPMLMLVGWLVFGPIGSLIGLVIAIAGSFYSKKTIKADVLFHSGEKLAVEGWNSDIQNLVRFAASK